MTKLRNVHPGEVLFEEFLNPLGISQNRLALDNGVPPRRINEIVHGTRRDGRHCASPSPLLRHV
jgi:addiction module HigA family antidote